MKLLKDNGETNFRGVGDVNTPYFKVNTSIPVEDVMSSPVTIVFEDDSVEHVAQLIAELNIGSVVVTNRTENPVGLITERDIVARVTAKNLLPSEIKAKEVMSSPLRTIEPDMDIKEAAKMMKKHSIRRLIVMDKGRMAGIISSRDIVAITPALIEIIIEKARINQEIPLETEVSSAAGYCDRCGQWYDTLVNVEGEFICEECNIELEVG